MVLDWFNLTNVFLGVHSYLLENDTQSYIMGTVSTISFLIGFLLLEYALSSYEFGNLFTAWGAGIAALLAVGGIYFWWEPFSTGKSVSTILIFVGVCGLIFDSLSSKNRFRKT